MSTPRRRRAGGQDAKRVLLLHGLGGRPRVWDRFCAHLTDQVELWDVELPWHAMGRGEWSHRTDQVDMLLDTLDGFDAVVAHSYAANLVVEAFAEGRAAPRPTVLVSPFYRSRPEDFSWSTISRYLNDFHHAFVEALRVGDTGRFPEEHRDWMALRLRDRIGPYGWMRFFESYLRSPFLDLTTITAPLLVLNGRDDIAAKPAGGRSLADALPHGRFVLLDGCGHFPMLEQPARFARLVGEFLTAAPVSPISPAARPAQRTMELT